MLYNAVRVGIFVDCINNVLGKTIQNYKPLTSLSFSSYLLLLTLG